jgi:hypothetical protein
MLLLMFYRHTVQPLVCGVSGACYQRYASRAAAELAFAAAEQASGVSVLL